MKSTFFRRRNAAALLAILVCAAACGPFHRGPSQDGSVVFANESIDQADVYASGPDRNPIRIGTVGGNQTQTLTVPATIVSQGQVNLFVRLLAGGTVSSGLFPLHAGDAMRARLTADQRSLIVLPAGS
jgi:hypothetical protein